MGIPALSVFDVNPFFDTLQFQEILLLYFYSGEPIQLSSICPHIVCIKSPLELFLQSMMS